MGLDAGTLRLANRGAKEPIWLECLAGTTSFSGVCWRSSGLSPPRPARGGLSPSDWSRSRKRVLLVRCPRNDADWHRLCRLDRDWRCWACTRWHRPLWGECVGASARITCTSRSRVNRDRVLKPVAPQIQENYRKSPFHSKCPDRDSDVPDSRKIASHERLQP